MFSKGQASTIGLMRTSIKPLPIAYNTTDIKIPINGIGNNSGKIAIEISPIADNICEETTQIRYPILSTNLIAAKSVNNCVRKNIIGIKAILSKDIAYVFLNVKNKSGA